MQRSHAKMVTRCGNQRVESREVVPQQLDCAGSARAGQQNRGAGHQMRGGALARPRNSAANDPQTSMKLCRGASRTVPYSCSGTSAEVKPRTGTRAALFDFYFGLAHWSFQGPASGRPADRLTSCRSANRAVPSTDPQRTSGRAIDVTQMTTLGAWTAGLVAFPSEF